MNSAIIWTTAIVTCLLLVVGLRAASAQNPNKKTSSEVAEIFKDLRTKALSMKANEINPSSKEGEPFGIVMETGYPNAVFSLVAFSTGDTSLYFSNGGGMIGGGQVEAVRNSAVELVKFSNNFLPLLTKTTEFPLPAKGNTRFFILTDGAVLSSSETAEDALGNNREKLSPLFHKAHDVIARLRESQSEKRP